MFFVARVVLPKHHLFLNRYPSRHTRRSTATRKGDDGTPEIRQTYLDDAALDFAKGIEAGLTPDEIILLQMGVQREDELSDVQRRYKTKLIEKLNTRAEEMKKEKEKCMEFEAGKVAYGRGAYPTCCELLEQAALQHAEVSLLGGDIRLWLALTYQALGRTKDCVELFRRLRDKHPNKKTRQQAKDLLYIIEAPKLRIGEDERIKLPVLKDLRRAPPRMSISRTRVRQTSRRPSECEKTFEERFWESYRPPIVLRNRYVQAAFVAIALCLAVYSAVYRSR